MTLLPPGAVQRDQIFLWSCRYPALLALPTDKRSKCLTCSGARGLSGKFIPAQYWKLFMVMLKETKKPPGETCNCLWSPQAKEAVRTTGATWKNTTGPALQKAEVVSLKQPFPPKHRSLAVSHGATRPGNAWASDSTPPWLQDTGYCFRSFCSLLWCTPSSLLEDCFCFGEAGREKKLLRCEQPHSLSTVQEQPGSFQLEIKVR